MFYVVRPGTRTVLTVLRTIRRHARTDFFPAKRATRTHVAYGYRFARKSRTRKRRVIAGRGPIDCINRETGRREPKKNTTFSLCACGFDFVFTRYWNTYWNYWQNAPWVNGDFSTQLSKRSRDRFHPRVATCVRITSDGYVENGRKRLDIFHTFSYETTYRARHCRRSRYRLRDLYRTVLGTGFAKQ